MLSMKARVINAAIWAAVAIAAATMTAVQWSAQGASVKSLVVGILFYVLTSGAIWYVLDQAMKGAQQ